MKIKTREADGLALNYLVALVEGAVIYEKLVKWSNNTWQSLPCNYCGVWDYGGPLMQKYDISVQCFDDSATPDRKWNAYMPGNMPFTSDEEIVGPTQLVAAMRCLVIDKLGEEVALPEGLL